MYRLNDILTAFSTLVGWEGLPDLEKSDSGLYFQEAHPLLTLRAMKGVMPKDMADRYAPYDEYKRYGKGDRVRFGNDVYESRIAKNEYPIDSNYWKKLDLLAEYLRKLTESGIKKSVSKFVNDKIAGQESKNIIERRTLFDGAGRKEARNHFSGRLVGFEITPLRSNGVTTILNKVGLQFYGNIGTVRLYLFHSSCPDPIAFQDCDYDNERGGFMWFDLDWTLPYMSETLNAGGSWYVVYEQDSLPPYMESINFGRDWSREPCGTCNKGDVQLYRTMSKYATFSPFYVAVDNWDKTLWDIADNIYCYGNNFGMNFMVTMSCDVTDAILLEKHQFAQVIQLQVASDALRVLALNPEVSVNRVQANADRDNILFELSGNGQGIKGLQGELEKAYKALSIDTKGLDPICMGCHNKGIRYGSI